MKNETEYQELKETVMGFFGQLDAGLKESIESGEESIVDLKKYIAFRIRLARASLTMPSPMIGVLIGLAEQLDRTLTVAETLRYRAKYH